MNIKKETIVFILYTILISVSLIWWLMNDKSGIVDFKDKVSLSELEDNYKIYVKSVYTYHGTDIINHEYYLFENYFEKDERIRYLQNHILVGDSLIIDRKTNDLKIILKRENERYVFAKTNDTN